MIVAANLLRWTDDTSGLDSNASRISSECESNIKKKRICSKVLNLNSIKLSLWNHAHIYQSVLDLNSCKRIGFRKINLFFTLVAQGRRLQGFGRIRRQLVLVLG